jgi:hypothetical protein
MRGCLRRDFTFVKPAPCELFSALGGISQLRLTGRGFRPIIAVLPCSFHDAASPRRLASSTTRHSTAASIRFWRQQADTFATVKQVTGTSYSEADNIEVSPPVKYRRPLDYSRFADEGVTHYRRGSHDRGLHI